MVASLRKVALVLFFCFVFLFIFLSNKLINVDGVLCKALS